MWSPSYEQVISKPVLTCAKITHPNHPDAGGACDHAGKLLTGWKKTSSTLSDPVNTMGHTRGCAFAPSLGHGQIIWPGVVHKEKNSAPKDIWKRSKPPDDDNIDDEKNLIAIEGLAETGQSKPSSGSCIPVQHRPPRPGIELHGLMNTGKGLLHVHQPKTKEAAWVDGEETGQTKQR